jgi:hypothetical protein
MDKSIFWKLIDDARREAGSSDGVAGLLVDKLAGMDIGGIMRWKHIFDAYQKLSYKSRLWAAAYVINGGCSDDGFDYFRGWLTAQGKDVFLRALADPDSLVDVDVEMDEAFDEEMLAVGYEAYFKKSNMTQRDYGKARAASLEHKLSDDERRDLAQEIHYAPDMDLPWDEDNPGVVVPKLSEKFA